MQRRVKESYTACEDRHWKVWHDYCVSLGLDPLLHGFQDPVPILLVFCLRYIDGRIATHGNPVKASTVLISIGRRSCIGGPLIPVTIGPARPTSVLHA
jgi:hypothetical protein